MITELDKDLRTSYILLEYDEIQFQKWKDEYRHSLEKKDLHRAEHFRLVAISFFFDIQRDKSRIASYSLQLA